MPPNTHTSASAAPPDYNHTSSAYDGASAPPDQECGGAAAAAAAAMAAPVAAQQRHTFAGRNIYERLNDLEWRKTASNQQDRRWYSVDAEPSATADAVNKLRVLSRVEEKLPGGGKDFPKLIVIGSNDTGKSTVLNRFIQFKILAARGEVCTKRPVRVEMRDTQDDDPNFACSDAVGGHQTVQAVVTIFDKTDCTKSKGGTTEMFLLRGRTPDDVDGSKDHLAMLQYIEERSAPNDTNFFSKMKGYVTGSQPPPEYIADELIVTVKQPGMPHFDLLDLPGMDNFVGQTKDTIMKYFNKDTIHDTFILVFRDVNVAPWRCPFAAEFYKALHDMQSNGGLTKKDIQHHILGICTKVDKVLEKASLDGAESNSEVYNQQLASKVESWFADDGADAWNRKNYLKTVPKIEWMAVLNPNKHEADANMTFSDAAKKEAWFYGVLFQGKADGANKQCGIDAVRTRLMQKYSEFCTDRVKQKIWPAIKSKLVTTHKELKGWGWDPREEGSDLEKRAVIADAASQLLRKAASTLCNPFTNVWAQPQVKQAWTQCERSSSITACRTGIVGKAGKPGIVTHLLNRHAQDSMKFVGSPNDLAKFVKMQHVCGSILDEKATQGLKSFANQYDRIEEIHNKFVSDAHAAGETYLDCSKIVYDCKAALCKKGGLIEEVFDAAGKEVHEQINTPAFDTSIWLDSRHDGALDPHYATLCSDFHLFREIAELLNRTFGVGGDAVGIVGRYCPPVQDTRRFL